MRSTYIPSGYISSGLCGGDVAHIDFSLSSSAYLPGTQEFFPKRPPCPSAFWMSLDSGFKAASDNNENIHPINQLFVVLQDVADNGLPANPKKDIYIQNTQKTVQNV